MKDYLAFLKAKNARNFMLNVLSTMRWMQKFWENFGFQNFSFNIKNFKGYF